MVGEIGAVRNVLAAAVQQHGERRVRDPARLAVEHVVVRLGPMEVHELRVPVEPPVRLPVEQRPPMHDELAGVELVVRALGVRARV